LDGKIYGQERKGFRQKRKEEKGKKGEGDVTKNSLSRTTGGVQQM